MVSLRDRVRPRPAQDQLLALVMVIRSLVIAVLYALAEMRHGQRPFKIILTAQGPEVIP